MPSTEPDQPTPHLTSLACRHLRTKGMYVYTDGLSGEASHPDYDNTVYWCFKTSKDFGPDDQFVNRDSCRDCNRECYEPV